MRLVFLLFVLTGILVLTSAGPIADEQNKAALPKAQADTKMEIEEKGDTHKMTITDEKPKTSPEVTTKKSSIEMTIKKEGATTKKACN